MESAYKIVGLDNLLSNLRKHEQKAQQNSRATASVGYTAEYAVYVHEINNPSSGIPRPPFEGRKWAPGVQGVQNPQGKSPRGYFWDNGHPKFLEKPARELASSGELGKLITTAYKNGASLEDGLLLAALRIQRESMAQAPLDTGNLKASAFTRKGESGQRVMAR